MTDFSTIDMTQFLKIAADELRDEIDRQIIDRMIDHMMPDREKYESFYHDHYNGLINSENMTDFQLYLLHRTLYNAHSTYHTPE